MKILQVNSHYNKGGAGKIVSYIHNELLKRGISSFVAYGRGDYINESNVHYIGNKMETYFDAIITRMVGLSGYNSIFNTKKLIRLIKEVKPDVIHLHVIHGYYLNFNMVFKYINANKIPVVWTFHDCHAFTGNCGYYYDCYKWQTGCKNCEYLRDYPKSIFFDFTKFMWLNKRNVFTKNDNKIVISPSEWMTNDAHNSYFGKYKCITINNGIDTSSVFYLRDKQKCREKHGFNINDKILLGISFGQDNPRKGVKYLIQLAKDLRNQDIKLILIGWNKKYDSLLEGMNNVTTLPFTNNQNELAEYYSLADLFLLPSLAENYATVVIESLACGTPVIGFNVGGVSEQIKNGKGIAVLVENQKELNKAVLDVLNHKIKFKTRSEIANYTQINNSISTMVDKYIEVYNKVISYPWED